MDRAGDLSTDSTGSPQEVGLDTDKVEGEGWPSAEEVLAERYPERGDGYADNPGQ